MQIKLQELEIKDFRGIKHLKLKLDGDNVVFYGRNGTGKSSIGEAIHYLLFNQSVDERSINVVPNDKDSIPQKELTPTVKATFKIDEQVITFERKSVYNKASNGRSNKQLINDVDKSVSDYNNYINDIIDVEKFKLLTNLNTFFKLDWKTRRELLTSLIDGISDDDIINNNKVLAPLKNVFQTHTLDERTLIVKRSIKQVKDEIATIPVRIEENLANVVEVDGNKEQLEFNNKQINEYINLKRDEIHQLKNGGGKSQINAQIIEKQAQYNQLKSDLTNTNRSTINGRKDEINVIKGEVDNLERKIKTLSNDKANAESERKKLLEEYHAQRTKLKELEQSSFEFEPNTHCECCSQAIPEALQKEVYNRALAKWNTAKADDLQTLTEKLNHLVAVGKSAKEDIDEFDLLIEAEEKKLEIVKKELATKESSALRLEEKLTNAADSDEMLNVLTEIENLKDQLETGDDFTADIEKLESDIAKQEQQKADNNVIIGEIVKNEALNKRIEELKAQEVELQKRLDTYQEEKDLLEQFTQIKMESISDAINSKFEVIKVKLFNHKNNGELEETCKITVDGVEYGDGLNTSGEMRAGFDVIKTLNKEFDLYPPLIIDNAESIENRNIPELDTQLILTKVSELKKHDKLEMVVL